MEFIIDCQGFSRSLNNFTFKEVAIIACQQDSAPLVYLFEPPFLWSKLLSKYKSSNAWLSFNHHGLSWGQGDIPYDDLEAVLRSVLQNATKLYVKVLEKKRWLENIIDSRIPVINLEDLGCPALVKAPQGYCTHHMLCKRKFMCAAYNVKNIKAWMSRRKIKSYDEVG